MVRVSGFDNTRGVETVRLSFIVNRPADEPGFQLERTEMAGRQIRYTITSYAAREPSGRRYG
jgi:ribulose-bisphosphate carboxylase small chain